MGSVDLKKARSRKEKSDLPPENAKHILCLSGIMEIVMKESWRSILNSK